MAPRGVTIAACLTFALPAWAEVDVSQFGIQSASEITDPALRDLRMRMVGGASLTYKQVRALADAGDGLAAFKTAQALESEDDPDLLDDAIHYYAVAARTGRDFAVRRLVSLLRSYEPALKPGLQKNAEDALRFQASSGNVIAAQALSDMYLTGRPFGKNIARGMEYMELAAGKGDGKAAVRLAMMYLKGTDGLPADPELARAALTIAAGSADLGSRTIAENLLRTMPEPPVQPAGVSGDAAVVQQAASTDDAPLIKPRPRPAGMTVLIAESLALRPDDPRAAAPPRRPAALEQAVLQREVSQ
jgi:Sel1 repeat